MKNALVLLLVLTALALCGVSVAQWRREAALRGRIAEADARLREKTAALAEAGEKSDVLDQEITRLSQLRADTEAKLLEVTDELAAARKLLEGSGAALGDRHRAVEEQNAAITAANARLRQITAERDRAIEQLNQRTRAFNELTAKYHQRGR